MNRRTFLQSSLALPSAAAVWIGTPPFDWRGLRFGIISDEVSEDFEVALKWMTDQKLRFVEPRNLWGTYVMDLGERDLRRAVDLLARYKIEVSNICTPYLKATLPGTVPIPNHQMDLPFGIYPYSEHRAILRRAFQTARALSTNKIRIFSLWRVADPTKIFDRVKSHLVDAVTMAEQAGMVLLLENESACNVATGEELAAMLREIPSKSLQALWDPGNAFNFGETAYPEGYRKLDRARIAHMHLKDALRTAEGKFLKWVPIGRGQIDIRGQLAALARDRYSGVISIETHYIPENGTAAEGSLETVRGLRRILESSDDSKN